MSKKSLTGFLLLALFMPLSIGGVAWAGEFTFKPRVFTSATYNDNVQEVKGGKGDYVGTIKPGLTTTYDSARLKLNVGYDLEYKTYLDGVLEDETNHRLNAFASLEAVEDRVFIEISDSFQKVYEDNTRGDVPDGDTSQGTTDQNIFGVKPYLRLPLQERTQLTVGGEFQDIWYSEEDNIDKRVYRGFADVDHELTDVWLATFGVGYEHQDPRFVDGGYQRYNLLFGTKYSYAKSSFLELRWEPSHTDYERSSDTDKQYHPYFIGITHAFSERIIGDASSSLEFSEDPRSSDPQSRYVHQVNLATEYDRGNIKFGVAYNDYEQRDATSRSTYWRPSLSGLHRLTERLHFRYSSYTDMYTNPHSDKYWFTLLNLDYAFTERSTFGLSYRHKHNDEQGSRLDYNSNTFGVTFNWAH